MSTFWMSTFCRSTFCTSTKMWYPVNFTVVLFFIIFEALLFLKYTQWQCILSFDNSTAMYKDLKPLHTGGIRTRDLLFWRRTRWPLCHATRATQCNTLFYFLISILIFFLTLSLSVASLSTLSMESMSLSSEWMSNVAVLGRCPADTCLTYVCRVTRLGELLTIERLFTLGVF
jgi:hypothetical protein